jgi:pantetheine-phosphate adenylyltransferase
LKSCVFAGTFDPITTGHQDIILGLAKAYQKVIVVIGQNPQKESFFTENERLQLLNECFKGVENVECYLYSDYKDGYSEFLQSKGVSVYARGIRDKKEESSTTATTQNAIGDITEASAESIIAQNFKKVNKLC